jgi:hypothetical protein
VSRSDAASWLREVGLANIRNVDLGDTQVSAVCASKLDDEN